MRGVVRELRRACAPDAVVTILRQIGAERRQREVLKDEAAQQPAASCSGRPRARRAARTRSGRGRPSPGSTPTVASSRRARARRRRCRPPRAGGANERGRTRMAVADADVLDRDHHLRQQVEEIDQREPHDQRARGRERGDASSRAGRRCFRQRVAAEHERRDRRRRSARRRAAGTCRAGCSGATSAGSRRGTARCRRDSRGAAREPERRPLDRSGVRLGLGEQRDRSALDDEGQRRAAEDDQQERDGEGDTSASGLARKRANTRADDLADVAAESSPTSASSSSATRKMPPMTGTASSSFSVDFGDELDDDQRPVRGRDERAALRAAFESGCMQHRDRVSSLPLRYPALRVPRFTCARERRVSCAAAESPAGLRRRRCDRAGPAARSSCGGSADCDGRGRRASRRTCSATSTAMTAALVERRLASRATIPSPRAAWASRPPDR